jgi:uracil-DNA glycosylase
VRPRVLVALGASAARALLGRPVVLARQRGALAPYAEGCELLLTVHPSWLLRLRDEDDRERERRQFVAELAIAGARAGLLG